MIMGVIHCSDAMNGLEKPNPYFENAPKAPAEGDHGHE